MEKGSFLTDEMQERLDIIEHKLKFVQQKPLVAVVVDFAPVKTDSHVLCAEVEKAGGTMVHNDEFLAAELILAYKKNVGVRDVVSALSAEIQAYDQQQMPAVKNNCIYIIDREKVNENSPVVLMECLAEIINPKQFVFGYEGNLWVQFIV